MYCISYKSILKYDLIIRYYFYPIFIYIYIDVHLNMITRIEA